MAFIKQLAVQEMLVHPRQYWRRAFNGVVGQPVLKLNFRPMFSVMTAMAQGFGIVRMIGYAAVFERHNVVYNSGGHGPAGCLASLAIWMIRPIPIAVPLPSQR